MQHIITQNKALTAFTLIFLPITLALGFWQLERSAEKRMIVAAAQQGASQLNIDANTDLPGLPDYQQIALSVAFAEPYIWLLDNQIWQSKVGVDVLGMVPVGSRYLLINRGWISWTNRASLPSAKMPQGRQALVGTLAPVTGKTFVLSQDVPQTHYPQLRQSVVLTDIESQTEQRLWPYMLHLQNTSDAALQPHWRMIQMGSEKHIGYAVQWFGLAITLLVLYVYRLRQYIKSKTNKDADE